MISPADYNVSVLLSEVNDAKLATTLATGQPVEITIDTVSQYRSLDLTPANTSLWTATVDYNYHHITPHFPLKVRFFSPSQ